MWLVCGYYPALQGIDKCDDHHSTFTFNNGGLGGAVSTVYLPLTFSGQNLFHGNKGRTMVVGVACGEGGGDTLITL